MPVSDYEPQFIDGCEHGAGYFIRRVRQRNGQFADLYVFPAEHGAELCLRYGCLPHEYASPGPVLPYLLRHPEHIADDVRRALSDLYQTGRLAARATIEPREIP